MQTQLRPATLADEPGIVETIKAVYDEYGFTWDPEDYHADLYDLKTHYLDPGHPFYVWEFNLEGVQHGLVGTVALEFFPTIPGPGGEVVEFEDALRIAGCDCALNRLYVHPLARRRGIASSLTERILAEARLAGCKAMEIWSDKRFTAAHELYKKLGARQVGDRICDDPDVSPEFGLILEL